MAEHFISRQDAEADLLMAAAYLAESIPPGEAHASAIAAVVLRFLESGNVDLAAELANSVDDPFTRDRLLIAVAAKCAELDDDEYALQLAEAIEDPGHQSQGYERIGTAKADKGQIDKAGDVAALMVHPDGVLARVAVRRAADGDLTAALVTIGEIEYARDGVIALNSIAAEAIKADDFDRASQMLSTAVEKAAGIEHDEERIRSYIEIGAHLIEAGQKGRAVEVFESARSEAEELDNAHRDPLLAHIAIGFLNAGSVDLADRVLDVVTDKTQIATVVLAFARDHWRKEERPEAVEALEEAFQILRSQHESETRDSKSKFALMGTIAAQFAGFDLPERAVDAADGIPDEAQRISALSRIASICTVQKNEPIARQTLEMITAPDERAAALIGMSDAVADADKELSEGLLREAESAVETIDLLGPKGEALLAVAGRYSQFDKTAKIRTLVSEILRTAGLTRDEAGRVSLLAAAAAVIERAGIELQDDDAAQVRALLAAKSAWTGR